MAHRNRVLADYNTAELREVEIFCTTKTTVDNPLLAPSGHGGRKTFLDSQWQDQYWDDWSWYESEESYAAKRKGKKGKKGKGKGKYSKDGKDGKSGKEGQSQLAEAAPSSVTAATTFYADYINPLNLSFTATEDKKEEAFSSQPLTPTAMVLDSGCTRAMASRVAAQDLMKFCDDNPNRGIWYTIAETTSQFTFANSESSRPSASKS
eukprot:s3916_g6.t1